jgi:hypothetical protein
MQIVKYEGFHDHLAEQRIPRAHIFHLTMSGIGINGDINWWLTDRKKAIATPHIVSRDGTITELFDPRYKCYHTGINGCNTSVLGTEDDNWGELTEKNGHYFSWTGKEIDPADVIELPLWRGYRFYEKLTDKQMKANTELAMYIHNMFKNIKYEITRDWIVDPSTFCGITTHSCIHPTKMDSHPLLPLFA